MATIMLAYATRDGCTTMIAARIANTLRTSGHHVDVVDLRDPEPGRNPWGEYDAIVIGDSLDDEASRREISDWVQRHTAELARTPSALFTVAQVAADDAPINRVTEGANWQRVAHFSDGLPNCDWYAAVDRFTQEFSRELLPLASR